MLLRSISTPVFQSLLHEPESFVQMTPKSRSCSIPSPSSLGHDRIKKTSRNLSESDLVISTCMHAKLLVPAAEMGCKAGDAVGGGGGDWSGAGAGGWGGGDDGGCSWDSNSKMEWYYEKMIEANPGNSMLFSNYARFLKEIRGDIVKAEEYCERAILVNPNDGDVLSLYAELIWRIYGDANRALLYFDRALKAAPDNSYVMASYARFLWEAEDEIEDQQ